jgi:hypothetical protein
MACDTCVVEKEEKRQRSGSPETSNWKMVCPMRLIVLSVVALVAGLGVYLTFFWTPSNVDDVRKKKARGKNDEMDDIDDAESSEEEEEEEEEEMKGGGSISSNSSASKMMNVVKETSTFDLVTGNVMFKQFSTGSLIAIGAAHIAGFVIFHHVYCVPS